MIRLRNIYFFFFSKKSFQKTLIKLCLPSLLKEAGSKGDIQAKLFYIRESLREKDDEDDFTEMALMLQEIIGKDPFQPEALFYLGFFHEKGIGVEKDEKISFHLYKYFYLVNEFSFLIKQ